MVLEHRLMRKTHIFCVCRTDMTFDPVKKTIWKPLNEIKLWVVLWAFKREVWWLFENLFLKLKTTYRQMQNVNDVHRSYFCFFFLLASTQAWWLQVVCQARESTKGGRLYSFRRKFIFKIILQKCTTECPKMGGIKTQT